MSWIAPFRSAILAQVPRLQQHGFSWLGEDDIRFTFTDGEVQPTFEAERYDQWLSAWVRHLGSGQSEERFWLDFVMQIVDDEPAQTFVANSPQDWARLVSRYVDYLLAHKARLFGPQCPYAQRYAEFNRQLMKERLAEWMPKP